MKRIAILGSTGSIGTQTLEVVRHSNGELVVTGLSCGSNLELFKDQISEFKPLAVAIRDEKKADELSLWLEDEGLDCELFTGDNCNSAIATMDESDIVVAAMVGVAGLAPVIDAISCGKDIALANKETLVAGGEIVMPLAREKNVRILPVDSEHSAIWQCLWGQPEGSLDRILLTASGGPFRGYTREQLENVTLEAALNHPTWKMGGKVTVDSSTMMNKGLEVLEASHLYGVSVDRIDVVVHPQSVIHSMIRLCDGSVLAQMGKPNMMMPIEVALYYPDRGPGFMEKFDPFAEGMNNLTFERCDTNVFGLLGIAYEAGRLGGIMPAVMNAANEIAVGRFLNGKLRYTDIERCVREVFDFFKAETKTDRSEVLTLDKIFEADRLSRAKAEEVLDRGI